ncbi:MAG: DUF2892 domain-containing protein [Verrucomicrobia bacterium]|nr:MAG: DUF2892 domain-containing protein [Verrucomicrobiota bacterium]
MKIDSLIRLLAGTVVLIGSALTHFVSPWWLLLPVFAGVNLIQSVFTGFCPPASLLRKLGWLDETGLVRWGGRKHDT